MIAGSHEKLVQPLDEQLVFWEPGSVIEGPKTRPPSVDLANPIPPHPIHST